MKLVKYLLNKIILLIIFNIFVEATTLQSILIETIKSNPLILEKKLEILKNNALLNESHGAYYPVLDIQLNYGAAYNENITHDNNNMIYKSLDEKSIKVTMKQNIFQGFKNHYDIKSKKVTSEFSKYDKEDVINNILFKTIQIYLELVKNKYQISLAKIYLNKMDYYLKLSRKKQNLIGLQEEYLSILENIHSMKLNLLEKEMDYKKNYTVLMELTNNKKNITINEFQFINYKNVELDYSLNKQSKINPTLKMKQLSIKNSMHLYNISKSSYYPRIDFEIGFNTDNKNSLNYVKNTNKYAYVNIGYNIFNGLIDKYNIEKAKVGILKEKNKLQQQQNKLKRELLSKYYVYKKLKLEIPILKNKFINEFKLYKLILSKNELTSVGLLTIVNKLKVTYNTANRYITRIIELQNSFSEILYYEGSLKANILTKNQIQRIDNLMFIKDLIE